MRQLRTRIGEHLCSIRNIQKSKDKDNPKWGSIAQHFERSPNSSIDGLKVRGFFALSLPNRRGDYEKVLLQKEKEWIFRLWTMIPNTKLSLQVFLEH